MSLLAEWSSYALGDFLMFSPEVYFHLFVRYNAAIWPGQLLALALSALLLWLAVRPGLVRGRGLCLLLGLGWGWVGWGFLLSYYAEINLAARWFAWGFALQALLLLGLALWGRPEIDWRRDRIARIGLLTLLTAILLLPLLGPLQGRDWTGIELFLLSPDPTALGSLGLALMLAGPRRLLLAIVPLLWLYFSALSLLAMDSPLGTPLLVLTLLGNLALLLPSRPKPKDLSPQRRRGAEEA
ncbi:MAG: hypothetical protein IBX49_04365 [Gammaproteobacteria bacterium]|nr:hypothetical protein [Gammaproteobacteria bacterium]